MQKALTDRLKVHSSVSGTEGEGAHNHQSQAANNAFISQSSSTKKGKANHMRAVKLGRQDRLFETDKKAVECQKEDPNTGGPGCRRQDLQQTRQRKEGGLDEES
ncbi:MAG: hypothetical protein ACLQVX_22480 [Limisphaerales bacterium]